MTKSKDLNWSAKQDMKAALDHMEAVEVKHQPTPEDGEFFADVVRRLEALTAKFQAEVARC